MATLVVEAGEYSGTWTTLVDDCGDSIADIERLAYLTVLWRLEGRLVDRDGGEADAKPWHRHISVSDVMYMSAETIASLPNSAIAGVLERVEQRFVIAKGPCKAPKPPNWQDCANCYCDACIPKRAQPGYHSLLEIEARVDLLRALAAERGLACSA